MGCPLASWSMRGTLSPPVVLHEVGRRFGGVEALAGVTLQVWPGQCLVLMGHNGSGKTTLLSIVAGQLRATSGSVEVCGVELTRSTDPVDVRRHVAHVQDAPAFYPDLTVEEHAQLVGVAHGVAPSDILHRSARLIELLRLEDRRHFVPGQLSSGMVQKLQLLCTWVRDFDVVLLDEPTTALDPRTRQALWSLVDDAKSRDAAVMIATHHLDFPDDLADRVAILDRGRVAASGAASDVLSSADAKDLGLT